MKAHEKTSPPGGKRPYKATRLRVYGTVGEITMKVGEHAKTDGGNGKNMTKTNP